MSSPVLIYAGTPTDDDRPTPADLNELPHETTLLGGDEYSALLIDSRETGVEDHLVAHSASNESNSDLGERPGRNGQWMRDAENCGEMRRKLSYVFGSQNFPDPPVSHILPISGALPLRILERGENVHDDFAMV